MEDLEDLGIGQEGFEAWCVVGFAVEFDEVRRAVAARELHEAQAIAMRIEPERLGIDRDAVRKRQPRGQIALVEFDFGGGHYVIHPSVAAQAETALSRRPGASVNSSFQRLSD